MAKSHSLRDLLLIHELIFLLLVVLAGGAGGYGIHLWRIATSESVRIGQLTEEIQQTRGDLYRQMKELFDAQFLADDQAQAEYNQYTIGIKEHFHRLDTLANGQDESAAITNMRAAYQAFLAETKNLLNRNSETDTSVLKKTFNTNLELKIFKHYELVTQHAEKLFTKKQQQVRRQLRHADNIALTLFAIPVGLATLLLLFSRTFLQHAIARPIASVLRATQEISTGKLQHRAPEVGTMELAQLGYAINQMADDLTRSQEALVKSEKQAAQGALVPVLAHNIRNPLASIRATAQVVDDPCLDPDIRASLKDIISTVDRLERWTGSLLAYLHPLKPQYSETSLRSLVDGALSLLQTKLKEKSIEVIMKNWRDIRVNADVHLIEQAIYNLLINAIDASPINSMIELTGEKMDGFVIVHIADQGAGMPFTPELNALTPGPTTKRLGTGLGIPFAFKVCEAHGGTLHFSKRENVGTLVTMFLKSSP